MTQSYLAVLLLSFSAVASAAPQTADVLVVNKIRSNANLPGNLAFLNLASGQVVAHVPVGKEPHEVAVSADGRYAVVSNTGSYRQPGNSLSVFDVARHKETHIVLTRAALFHHAATTAREYGLPAVINVRNATSRIADGTWITLDGTTEEIRIEAESGQV